MILPEFDRRFGVIYADPPWAFQTWSPKGKGRSPERHYPVMDTAAMACMRPDIDRVAADDCVLLMWVTMPMLQTGLNLVKQWGFTYKTVGFSWVKTNADGKPFIGLGFWTRGKPQRYAGDVPQLVISERGRHSAKPPEVRKRIERLLRGPYLELFAREQAPGWSAWGNEIGEAA
jgi:N6-adenosine-specific RNA methylase IME4